MNRPIEHINHPGKFENESCIARLAYDVVGHGFGTAGDCDCKDTLIEANDGEYSEDWDCASDCASHVHRVYGPFTQADVDAFDKDNDVMCWNCMTAFLRLDHVDITESESGFVYASA